MMGARRDGGETLIEILLTVVIVGLTFTALFAALAGAGNAGNTQRTSVQTDVVLRNFAEATKAAAEACVTGGTYTVSYPSPLPTGYALSVTGSGAGTGAGIGSSCPPVSAPQLLTLRVTPPVGSFATMQIKVSTP
jgi:type II secretory pathway pseudopilin PulG